jgi:hypothetical protein
MNYSAFPTYLIVSTICHLFCQFNFFKIMMFWSVTPSNLVDSYECSLKMEAACCSKMLVITFQTTQCHNPKKCNLNFHHCENLRLYFCCVLNAGNMRCVRTCSLYCIFCRGECCCPVAHRSILRTVSHLCKYFSEEKCVRFSHVEKWRKSITEYV